MVNLQKANGYAVNTRKLHPFSRESSDSTLRSHEDRKSNGNNDSRLHLPSARARQIGQVRRFDRQDDTRYYSRVAINLAPRLQGTRHSSPQLGADRVSQRVRNQTSGVALQGTGARADPSHIHGLEQANRRHPRGTLHRRENWRAVRIADARHLARR